MAACCRSQATYAFPSSAYAPFMPAGYACAHPSPSLLDPSSSRALQLSSPSSKLLVASQQVRHSITQGVLKSYVVVSAGLPRLSSPPKQLAQHRSFQLLLCLQAQISISKAASCIY
jgi:hypothetical protein